MTEQEKNIIEIIETTLPQKLEENPYFIRYTFFEIIVAHNLAKNDEIIFDALIRNKLHNLGYIVYFTGTEYEYENTKRIVEDNEILVAIKQVEERTKINGRKIKKSKYR